MANIITGRMKSLGVSLDESELTELRILAAGDRRSISWLLREAAQDYLKKRKDDVRRFTVQRTMEILEAQSEQRGIQEKEDQIAQEVKEKAAAAGKDLDPASLKAAIASAVARVVKESEEQSPDKRQIIERNREQMLAEAKARFEKKRPEKSRKE